MKFILGVAAAALLVGSAFAQPAKTTSTTAPPAATVAATASKGIFSAAQATQGATLVADHCAACHGPSMAGQDMNPALTGATFAANWVGKPVSEFSDRIRTTMPMDNPGSLGLNDTALIVAAILQANGYPAGKTDLPSSAAAQKALMIDALAK